jgi:hypothetical protein
LLLKLAVAAAAACCSSLLLLLLAAQACCCCDGDGCVGGDAARCRSLVDADEGGEWARLSLSEEKGEGQWPDAEGNSGSDEYEDDFDT